MSDLFGPRFKVPAARAGRARGARPAAARRPGGRRAARPHAARRGGRGHRRRAERRRGPRVLGRPPHRPPVPRDPARAVGDGVLSRRLRRRDCSRPGCCASSWWLPIVTALVACAAGEALFALVGALFGQRQLVTGRLPLVAGVVGLLDAMLAVVVVPLIRGAFRSPPRPVLRLMREPVSPDSSRLRLGVLGVVVLSLFAALLVRLWYLQVMASDQYEAVSTNSVRLVTTEAPRGRILDRNGVELVRNRISDVVTVDRNGSADAIGRQGPGWPSCWASRPEELRAPAREQAPQRLQAGAGRARRAQGDAHLRPRAHLRVPGRRPHPL